MKARWVKLTMAQLILGVLFAAPPPAVGQSAFEVTGSGTVETNCLGTLAPGCTVRLTGQMSGTPILPGQFFLRLDTGSPNSLNGYPGGTSQGVCLPTSFNGTLTETGGDIYFNHAGLVCEEAEAGSPSVYHGTFRLTGGTGRFAAATGGGSVVATVTRDTLAGFVYLRGSISY
ncbi:MAG: hypothetical protein HY727_17625 [Candidatus Rokubacteria bacterium]|nr:hypothetical protein [Candidatus Rokubacteria bacterium]